MMPWGTGQPTNLFPVMDSWISGQKQNMTAKEDARLTDFTITEISCLYSNSIRIPRKESVKRSILMTMMGKPLRIWRCGNIMRMAS